MSFLGMYKGIFFKGLAEITFEENTWCFSRAGRSLSLSDCARENENGKLVYASAFMKVALLLRDYRLLQNG